MEEIVNTTETKTEEAPLDPRQLSNEDLSKMLMEEPTKEAPVVEEKPVEEVKPKLEKEEAKPLSREDLDALRTEMAELKKATEAKQRLIDKQANEIGALRKITPEDDKAAIKAAEDEYERRHLVEGKAAADDYWERFKGERAEKQRQLTEAQSNELIERRKTVVTQYLPEFETTLDTIAEVMKADGANQETIEAFKQTPYQLDPVALFNLSKRAEITKELLTVKQELEAAKTEIETLKKKPQDLIDRIKSATNSVTAKSSGTTAPDIKLDLSSLVPNRLSNAQLKELENQLSNTG